MVRIIIILFLSTQFCYSQISNSQFYFGRGLDSSAILTNDISDSSITFRKIRYVNGPKLIGNPGSGYDTLKCIKLGTGLSFSNDTLNASGASGNVNQNGNSYGAGMVIGTNDNNSFDLETNNVSRFSITSGATTGGELTATSITTNTNTFNNAFTLRVNSTGTPSTSFGSRILFQGKSSTTDNRDIGSINAIWNQATDASRQGAIVIYASNIAAVNEVARFTYNNGLSLHGGSTNYFNTGITTGANYTIGNSSNSLTLSTSSNTSAAIALTSTNNFGTIVLTSSGNSGGVSLITGGNFSTVPKILLDNSTFTLTSGNKLAVSAESSYTPTSGTGTFTQLNLSGTINQTGGANGVTRSLYLNPTLTAIADFRGIDIPYSNSSAYGIYQSGSATKNIFVGKTCFGSTSSPTALVALAAGTASANTAPLKFTSGTNLTTPEAGAVEYDASNLYITNGSAIRFTIAKMLSGSATLDFGNTAAGTSDDLTVTITGAQDGDEVVLGVPNAAMNASSSYFAWVSATNTITIRHNNYSTGAINPASATFKVSVIKR